MDFIKTLLLLFYLLSSQAQANVVNIFDLALESVSENTQEDQYDRLPQFGTWKRLKGECLNTRNWLLINNSNSQVKMYPHNPCAVESGSWNTLYSPQRIQSARTVHVDHLVPLKEAFVSGAHAWSEQRKCHFNNFLSYPYHLVLVSARENLRKQDSDPSQYIPPKKSFRCEYIKHWLIIKVIWGLSFDTKEMQAIIDNFESNNCSAENFYANFDELNQLADLTHQPIYECSK